jgi:hypothetical protein
VPPSGRQGDRRLGNPGNDPPIAARNGRCPAAHRVELNKYTVNGTYGTSTSHAVKSPSISCPVIQRSRSRAGTA